LAQLEAKAGAENASISAISQIFDFMFFSLASNGSRQQFYRTGTKIDVLKKKHKTSGLHITHALSAWPERSGHFVPAGGRIGKAPRFGGSTVT
jgi:hypothetical protein